MYSYLKLQGNPIYIAQLADTEFLTILDSFLLNITSTYILSGGGWWGHEVGGNSEAHQFSR